MESVLGRHLLCVVACTAVGLAVSSGGAWAGSGTAADPYRNIGANWSFGHNGAITQTWQDITSTASLPPPASVQFWAYQPRFALASGVAYIGFQRQGNIFGTPTPKTAHFSFFSNDVASSFKLVDTAHCQLGADDPNPASGVSCAITYNWANNQSFRVIINIYENITTPGWCPTGAASCTVYQGMIAPTSNPTAATQIGVWSVKPTVYGRLAGSADFLENFNVVHLPGCARKLNVAGLFVLPFKKNGTTTYSPSGSTGFDRFVYFGFPPSPIPVCAWQWFDWVASRVTY